MEMTMKATSNQYTKITLFLNVFLNSFPKNFAVIHVLAFCAIGNEVVQALAETGQLMDD